MRVLVIKPTSPFHLQGNRADLEHSDSYPRSDTISSAIASIWMDRYGSIPGFPDGTPYVVGSGFPAILQSGQYRWFVPKTSGITIDSEVIAQLEQVNINPKQFKKIQFIELNLMRMLLDGFKISNEVLRTAQFGSESAYLGEQPVNEALLKQDLVTRVVLDRVSAAATPFHFSRIHYAPSTRIWIPFEVGAEYEKEFLAVVRMLGDEGIGADRTSGHGQFELESVQELPIANASKGSLWMSLGLYNPTTEEQDRIDWQQSYYQLVLRQGWVANYGLRRKPIMMVTEGSVLETSQRPTGRWSNVLDKSDHPALEQLLPHPVYRDGRTLFLAV